VWLFLDDGMTLFVGLVMARAFWFGAPVFEETFIPQT
jgi:hypothetical protein